MSKTLILIDLSGLFWANWHATSDQDLSEAFNRTVERVRALSSGFDHTAVCLDAPPYKRKELHPGYKAQRVAPPAQALEQFKRVKERLTADGFLLWASPGHEADDVIASAVKHARDDGLEVTIASSDKDLLQLVSDERGVCVFSLATGVYMREAEVKAKYGVPPAKMLDLLALTGDTSDNVPGVPGVGPKNAAKLLEAFGSVAGVLHKCDQISAPKLRENVFRSGDAVRLALKLIELDANVQINWADLYAQRTPKKLNGPGEWDDAEFGEAEPVAQPKEEPKVEAAKPAIEAEPAKPAPTNGNGKNEAMVVRPPEWSLALEPHDVRSAYTMAKYLHESRLFGAFPNPEAIFAIILRGRALGLDAVTSLANFHVIKGKPTMHASLIVGLILRSGKAKYFTLVESTDQRATYRTHRVGNPHPVEMSFTLEDALLAGLVEKHPQGRDGFRGVSESGKPSAWDKFRRTMLRWRSATELGRAEYSDVTAGLYTPDEISDGQSDLIDVVGETVG